MTFLIPAIMGAALIALRRPIGRLMLDWRNLFPPALRNPGTQAGEVMVTLVGVFMLVLSLVALIAS